jgi:hypothetical protein
VDESFALTTLDAVVSVRNTIGPVPSLTHRRNKDPQNIGYQQRVMFVFLVLGIKLADSKLKAPIDHPTHSARFNSRWPTYGSGTIPPG